MAAMAENEVILAFQKPLSPQDLGTCLTEVLKYVLYTKNQIPLPYDQLLRTTACACAAAESQGCESKSADASKSKGILCHKKLLQEKLKKLGKVLSILQCACCVAGSSFLEVVVILGATIVSPKAVYRVVIDGGLVREDASPLCGDNLRR